MKSSAKKSAAKRAGRKGDAKTIDEYLNSVTPEQRVALERLRKIIRATARATARASARASARAAATDAEECISYRIAQRS